MTSKSWSVLLWDIRASQVVQELLGNWSFMLSCVNSAKDRVDHYLCVKRIRLTCLNCFLIEKVRRLHTMDSQSGQVENGEHGSCHDTTRCCCYRSRYYWSNYCEFQWNTEEGERSRRLQQCKDVFTQARWLTNFRHRDFLDFLEGLILSRLIVGFER